MCQMENGRFCDRSTYLSLLHFCAVGGVVQGVVWVSGPQAFGGCLSIFTAEPLRKRPLPTNKSRRPGPTVIYRSISRGPALIRPPADLGRRSKGHFSHHPSQDRATLPPAGRRLPETPSPVSQMVHPFSGAALLQLEKACCLWRRELVFGEVGVS